MNPKVQFLNNYEKLRIVIRDLIIGHVIISIRDGEREVWRCGDGVWKDKRFRNFKVVQDFDLETFLRELLPLLNKVNDLLAKVEAAK
jgi:hypothetical protein